MGQNHNSREHFQIKPDSVLFDLQVTHEGARVYDLIAHHYREDRPVIGISHRFIAEKLGISLRCVTKCIGSLRKRGHIRKVGRGQNNLSLYILTSNVFANGKEKQ